MENPLWLYIYNICIIIRISIDDCPIKTSIYGEFFHCHLWLPKDTYNIIILGLSKSVTVLPPEICWPHVWPQSPQMTSQISSNHFDLYSISASKKISVQISTTFHQHFLAVRWPNLALFWPRHPAHSMQIANAIARKPAVLGDHSGSSLWGLEVGSALPLGSKQPAEFPDEFLL